MAFGDAILLAMIASFFVFMAVEWLVPSRRTMPEVKHWRLIGLAGFVVTMAVAVGAPLLIVPYLPTGMIVVDLSGWGNWGFLPLWMMTTFIGYWFHRTMHYFDVLWRAGHQLHHGVARVDMSSAMIFHPFDSLVQFVFASLIAAGLLGVTAEAAGWAGLWGTLVAYYQHWNVRTPAWTGWFIQRPEAHSVHHARGVHAYNYGNFPAWDMMFGTYRNPASFPTQYGFWDGASSRLGSLLAGRDVGQAG